MKQKAVTATNAPVLSTCYEFSLRQTQILLSESRNTLAFTHTILCELVQPDRLSPFPFHRPDNVKVITDFLTIRVQPYMNGTF
jgi:hypothetical protein